MIKKSIVFLCMTVFAFGLSAMEMWKEKEPEWGIGVWTDERQDAERKVRGIQFFKTEYPKDLKDCLEKSTNLMVPFDADETNGADGTNESAWVHIFSTEPTPQWDFLRDIFRCEDLPNKVKVNWNVEVDEETGEDKEEPEQEGLHSFKSVEPDPLIMGMLKVLKNKFFEKNSVKEIKTLSIEDVEKKCDKFVKDDLPLILKEIRKNI